MAIHAKPSGAYAEESEEWLDNINAFWQFAAGLGYTAEAFAGMMGNAQHEGGMNPWRWQNDYCDPDYDNGYGLFQYTPGRGYINDYGHYSNRYAPNLSVTQQTAGSSPDDGLAQIEVIDASGKYISYGRTSLLLPYVPDCADYSTLQDFMTCTNVVKATYLWVGFFEWPDWWRDQRDVPRMMQLRLDSANAVLSHLQPSPTISLLMYGGGRENIRKNILRR